MNLDMFLSNFYKKSVYYYKNMFSFFSEKNDFNAQKNEFNNHIISGFGQSFNFMSSTSDITLIDRNIDNMIQYINKKMDFIGEIPDKDTEYKNTNNVEYMKVLISLGLVRIQSQNELEHKEHLKLNSLETAKFQKKDALVGFQSYLKEYVSKLDVLKKMTIQNETLPDNTSYQIELKNKLEYFILKTKYFIFDIYLNHYVQYVYLLFAINIYKNTEAFFKLNAEQQKQIAILDKTNNLLKQYDVLEKKDSETFDNIKKHIDALINQTSNVSQFNKPPPQEVQKLKEINDKNPVNQNQYGGTITTAADGIISDIVEKHKHFYTVFRKTRNSMPGYFKMVNDTITEKITQLKELKNSITNLVEKDYELLKKTNEALSGLRGSQELSDKYNIKDHPVVKENMVKRLDEISKNIENTIEQTKNYGESIMNDTEQTATQINQQPSTDAVNETRPVQGGFVRSGTKFPKKNYSSKTTSSLLK